MQLRMSVSKMDREMEKLRMKQQKAQMELEKINLKMHRAEVGKFNDHWLTACCMSWHAQAAAGQGGEVSPTTCPWLLNAGGAARLSLLPSLAQRFTQQRHHL